MTHHSSCVHNFSYVPHRELKLHIKLDESCIMSQNIILLLLCLTILQILIICNTILFSETSDTYENRFGLTSSSCNFCAIVSKQSCPKLSLVRVHSNVVLSNSRILVTKEFLLETLYLRVFFRRSPNGILLDC